MYKKRCRCERKERTQLSTIVYIMKFKRITEREREREIYREEGTEKERKKKTKKSRQE